MNPICDLNDWNFHPETRDHNLNALHHSFKLCDGYSEQSCGGIGPVIRDEPRSRQKAFETMKSQQENDDASRQRSGVVSADAVLDTIMDPIIVIDTNSSIERLNPPAAILFGYSADELLGKDISCLIPTPENTKHDRFVRAYLIGEETPEEGKGCRVEAQHRDGSTLFVHLLSTKLPSRERCLFVVTIRDLTEQQREEMDLMSYIQDLESAKAQSETQAEKVVELVEELAAEKEELRNQKEHLRENEKQLQLYVQELETAHVRSRNQTVEMVRLVEKLQLSRDRVEESRRVIEHQANHDPLTELGNRALLSKVLPEMIEKASDEGTKVGLIYIDLDNFKSVNDRLGHEAGDDLLCTVANAIRGCIRAEDEAIRQGGDEFAVAVRLTAVRNEVDLKELAERICRALTIAVEGPDFTIEISASLGIALFPEDGQDLDAILISADAAMYRAKRAGKGRIVR